MTHSDKLVALEFQYRTKASKRDAMSFQDQPKELAGTTQEKGKVPGKERDQNMRVFYSNYISKPAGRQAPIVSTVVRLLDNLSHSVLVINR